MRKKVLIGIGILVVLLVAAAAALPYVLDVDRYRPRVQTELQNRLDRSVTLGQMRLSYFPFGFRVENAVIGEDQRFATGRPFAQAQELYVVPRLMPLLRRKFELSAVRLRQPEIELVRNPQGEWNFATLGRAPADPAAPAPELVLHDLVVERGQVGLTDMQQKDKRRAVYRNIDLSLRDYAPGRAFRLELAATLPGEGAQRLVLSGEAGPMLRDHISQSPFDGILRLEQVSLAGLQRFLELEALQGTDSVLSGSAALRNQNGRMESSGSLRLERTRVRGAEIAYPITLEYDLTHDLNTEVLHLRKADLRLDRTPLSLTGRVNLKAQPAELDVHLTASEASLAEAARLASAFGVAFGGNTKVAGTMTADVRARGPATRPALEGDLRLRQVTVSGEGIAQPVRVPAVDLALTAREIRSGDFHAATGNTSLGVRFTLAQYNTATPSLDAALRTTDADLGELISMARAWGAGAAEGLRGAGRLSFDLRASGPTGNLSYSGSGSLREASLQTPALQQPLRIAAADLKFSRNGAVLSGLNASLGKTSAQGSLTVRDFGAPQVEFTLSADQLDVAEMQAILAQPGPPAAAAGKTAAEESVLRRTTGAGTVRIGAIRHEQLVLENVQAQVALDRGLIRLDPLTASLFGGTHRGAITVDARRSPATFSVASRVEGVDANRLVSAATSLRDTLYGSLLSDVKAEFRAGGAAGLAPTLNGTLALNLTEGRVARMDVMHEVGNIARFITGAERQPRPFTELSRLSGTFQVTDGVARTDDLQAVMEGGTMGAGGTINLVDQRLNLRLITVLSREQSQRVGGTQVGGYMTTVLANQQGELVIPVLVTGTLQEPRFAPDVQRIAEMKLKNLVPGLRNPQELTGGILGAIREGQAEGRTPQQTLQGIVGAVTGRDPQPPPEQEKQEPEATPEAQSTPQAQPQTPQRQVRDALEGLLGRPKPQPKPAEPPPPPPQ